MTLAVGTALQHGTYVVDAWVAEDTIGPVYLAVHVPTGQWVQLRVLGSRHPEHLPSPDDRQRFYQYLNQVRELGHPFLPTRLAGFEEEGVCYQVLTAPQGMALDRWIVAEHPLPPRRSLALVEQIIDVLEALRPLGWAGLRLTPDQVWCGDDPPTLGLTGFDLAPPAPAGDEAALVQAIAHLLYFLLTGQRAEATAAPLAVEVRRQHPELPTSLDAALEVAQTEAAITLAGWQKLLPAIADLPPARPTPPARPASAVVVSPPTPHEPGSRHQRVPAAPAPRLSSGATPRRSPAPALVLTGLVAIVAGLGVGFHLRLQPVNSASQDRLNPLQTFPPDADWQITPLWQSWDEAPTRRQRPDYGTAPSLNAKPPMDFAPNPQEPAAPPPAVTQPPVADPAPPVIPPASSDWTDWPIEDSPAPPAPVPPAPAPRVDGPAPAPEIAPAPVAPAPPPPLEAPPPLRPPEAPAPPAPLAPN